MLVPLERGGKAGLFGGAGVGKTVLLTEMIHNMVGHRAVGAKYLVNTAALDVRAPAPGFVGDAEMDGDILEPYESISRLVIS